MPMLPLLLRVLLSLCLILNGSGYAMASAHMSMGHQESGGAMGQLAADPADSAQPPCHQLHDAAPQAAEQAPGSPPDTAAVDSDSPSPDCCKSGACRCACVQHVPATIPVHALGEAAMEHAAIVLPLTLGHAAPALPDLIRPPIG